MHGITRVPIQKSHILHATDFILIKNSLTKHRIANGHWYIVTTTAIFIVHAEFANVTKLSGHDFTARFSAYSESTNHETRRIIGAFIPQYNSDITSSRCEWHWLDAFNLVRVERIRTRDSTFWIGIFSITLQITNFKITISLKMIFIDVSNDFHAISD